MNCSGQEGKYDLLLKNLDENHQFKLDSGEFMLETEREYSMKLDSLMKVIYNELIVVKKTNVKNIEIEQNKWIKQFDLKIKNIWKPLNKSMNEIGFISNDEKMFVYSKKSELIRIRILELINKLNK